VSGKLENVAAERNVLLYERSTDRERVLVVLNMGSEPAQVRSKAGVVLASTHLDREGTKIGDQVELRAGEGLILVLKA